MTATKHAENQSSEAAIQQVNLGYNTAQDRLLFKVGLSDGTELLIWLTNRITRMVWQLLNNETNLPTATSIRVDAPIKQAVAQFNQEMQSIKTMQTLDFVTEYEPRQPMHNDGALLATNAITMVVEGKKITLEMACLEGITVRINLNQELILAVCNMLQLACKEAGWQLETVSTTEIATLSAADINANKVLH